MTAEEWAQFVADAEASDEWTQGDREWLRAILQTTSAKRLFGELFEKLRSYEREWRELDLVTDAGRFAAVRKQGEMVGVEIAIELVRNLTEEE